MEKYQHEKDNTLEAIGLDDDFTEKTLKAVVNTLANSSTTSQAIEDIEDKVIRSEMVRRAILYLFQKTLGQCLELQEKKTFGMAEIHDYLGRHVEYLDEIGKLNTRP